MFRGLLHHGFRVSELAGILPEDIVLDAEVPYINIEHNHIRAVKNDYTQRHVPIQRSTVASLISFLSVLSQQVITSADFLKKVDWHLSPRHTP